MADQPTRAGDIYKEELEKIAKEIKDKYEGARKTASDYWDKYISKKSKKKKK